MANSKFKRQHWVTLCRSRALVSLLAGLLGGLLPSAQAHSAVYVGTWDPAFGAIFPNLGWKGQATFVLPAGCAGLTGSFANASAGCGGGGMQVSNAEVSFYDAVNDPAGTVTLQTLNFGSVPVVSMQIDSSVPGSTELLGATTGFFAPVAGQVAVAQAGGYNHYFHLILNGGQAAMLYSRDQTLSVGCALPVFGPVDPQVCGFSSTAPTIQFALVPEPASAGLLLAGLGLLAGVARVAKRRS